MKTDLSLIAKNIGDLDKVNKARTRTVVITHNAEPTVVYHNGKVNFFLNYYLNFLADQPISNPQDSTIGDCRHKWCWRFFRWWLPFRIFAQHRDTRHVTLHQCCPILRKEDHYCIRLLFPWQTCIQVLLPQNVLFIFKETIHSHSLRLYLLQLTSLFFFFLSFLLFRHKDQKRKASGEPYIAHPIGVARILTDAFIEDPATLQAAILHEYTKSLSSDNICSTVEDTNTKPEEIELHFGKQVMHIVMEVTDDKKLPKEKRKQLQIEHSAHLSTEAKLVKLAGFYLPFPFSYIVDKIHNLRDLSISSPW